MSKLREAKTLAAAWEREYNHHRPHSSMGYMPPAVFAVRLRASEPPSVGDAARCAAGIADAEIVWEGTDPVTITRLS